MNKLTWATLLAVSLVVRPPAVSAAPAPTMTLLSHTYTLGSFNQSSLPTWEFVSRPENVNNWTSLITLIDCPQAHTKDDLDGVARGIVNTYKKNHAQILLAKMIRAKSGTFDYVVAAFDEGEQHRSELDFVKVGFAGQHGCVLIYGARVSDAKNHRGKTKTYLDQHAVEIGKALENASIPSIDTLPRKVF